MKTGHPDIDKHLEKMAEDLRQRLQKNSGVLYVREGTDVHPKKDSEAALIEFGSATMGIAPQPFIQQTLHEFGKANGVKGL